jgi:hypothetical protein
MYEIFELSRTFFIRIRHQNQSRDRVLCKILDSHLRIGKEDLKNLENYRIEKHCRDCFVCNMSPLVNLIHIFRIQLQRQSGFSKVLNSMSSIRFHSIRDQGECRYLHSDPFSVDSGSASMEASLRIWTSSLATISFHTLLRSN